MSGQERYNDIHHNFSSPWPITSTQLEEVNDQPSSSAPSFTSVIQYQSYKGEITHGRSEYADKSRSSSNSSDFGSDQKMPKEIVGNSSSSSSSGSNAKLLSIPKARARVAMACVHCRQRKIRCDGQQPICTTCVRLGRECIYESISEQENIYTREKKRRSKEVKQGRLKSLQGIGIPIPGHHSIALTHGSRPPIPSSGGSSSGEGSSGAARYPGASTMGVIRDSRLGRQGRNRPYEAVQPQPHHSPMNPPGQVRLHVTPPPAPAIQRHNPVRRTPSDSVVPSRSTARRGVTLDLSNEATQQGPIAFTSLSQPTTPETIYSMHASMLSRELSSQQEPPSDIITQMPYQSSHFERDQYTTGGAAAFGSGFDYTPSPTYQSAETSRSSRSSAGDATMTTSTTSITAHAPGSTPYTMQRFPPENQNDLEAQLALRRRSSFDVGDFWRRSSVADAAVANFFDRVIQARGDRKSSAESVTSPTLQRFSVPDSVSFDSSSAFTATNESSDLRDLSYQPSGVYNNIHQGIQGPLTSGLAASPERLIYTHYDPYDRRSSEEQRQLQEIHQQQEWQQEENLHNTSSQQNILHLDHLPDFNQYRQYPASHTGGSNASNTSAGLHSSGHFTPPQHQPLIAGGGAMIYNTGYPFLTPPIPNIAPPPLPTPMTELSTHMFAMGAPSHVGGGYQQEQQRQQQNVSPYFHNESGQLHHPQQQQGMAAFVNSRHGSLSSNSIPEEEGEQE